MFANMMKWRLEHPTAEVKVQFNYPDKVCIIAPISEAIKQGAVSANANGLALMKFMWPRWNDASEPTVNMYRFILERVPPPKRPPPTPCPHCGHKIKVVGGFTHSSEPDKSNDVVPGSLTFCLHCSGISIFNDDLTMRAMPPVEFAALPQDLQNALNTAIKVVKENPDPHRHKRK